jgi:acetyl-CoA C-acetyltransferase
MPEAVIVDAIRTPIGRAGRGSLKTVRADELAATPLRALIERNPEVDFAETGDVMMGAASSIGEQGYNVGRNASLLAGIDHHVPACTVNRFCASSLQTLRMAFHAIKVGEGDQYIAAGVEAVSRAGLGAGMMEEAKHPQLSGSEGSAYDVYIPMGLTAENVATRCHVTREQQDEWAVISQNRAVEARDSGHFDSEIVPVTVPAHQDLDKEGNELDVPETVVNVDDGPRPGTTMEVLATLKPAFKEDGTVTAGNSCPLNDGAAAAVVMSASRAKELGIRPRARIVASAVSGIEPEIMGVGPIEAVKQVLARAHMTIDDIELMELNEAFAAQVLPVCEAVGMDPFSERFNPHGGAIALGHPFGMTGARIMTTLLNGLEVEGRSIGLETMCVGGGQGMAMIVERLI